jgi:hypothetical protein
VSQDLPDAAREEAEQREDEDDDEDDPEESHVCPPFVGTTTIRSVAWLREREQPLDRGADAEAVA